VTEREGKRRKKAEIIYSTNKTKNKNVDIAFHGAQIKKTHNKTNNGQIM